MAVGKRPPRSPAEITPGLWTEWCLSLPLIKSAQDHRRMLRVLLPHLSGISAETLRVVDRPIPGTPPVKEQAFTYQELQAIRARAAATFNAALVRIRTNREHLRRWYAGQFAVGSGDWLLGEALDHLLRTGEVPLLAGETGGRVVLPRHLGQVLGGTGAEQTWARLYLSREEARAAAVLLVAHQAWNRAVLTRMRVPEHDPAVGEAFDIHTVEINKRRRPVQLRYTTNNLLDAGPDTPGRLMSQVIEATELARQTLKLLDAPTELLLVWRRHYAARDTGSSRFGLGVPKKYGRTRKENSLPYPLVWASLRRLRRTVQVLLLKEPAQNTQATHENVYTLPEAAMSDSAHTTIARGLSDALNQAHTVVKMRMFLGGEDNHLLELADDPELVQAIEAGKYDTATGACTDFTNSDFTEPGLPCTASFLLCLACGNAVATRRHLPRLVYLQQALTELRAAVDEHVWNQDWRQHLLRLESLLNDHTTPEEQRAERRRVTAADRLLIDRMLRRKLDG
ncbi:hypothetical protein [Nonomuraea sp. NPDC049784]|uniref:hypothetical protein n=1 Tax=Nonomuraea sp. NPDC049784 TaxID=3154361 RepID=UPI0033DE96E9